MSHRNGLRVVRIGEPSIDATSIGVVRADVPVHAQPLVKEFNVDDINEDVTKSLAEACDQSIEQRLRRQLTERWPGRSYIIRWTLLVS